MSSDLVENGGAAVPVIPHFWVVAGARGGPHLCRDLPTGGAGQRDVAEQEGGVLLQVAVGVLPVAAWCCSVRGQLVTAAAFPHFGVPQFRLAPGGGVVKLGGGPSLVTNLNFVPWLFTITRIIVGCVI